MMGKKHIVMMKRIGRMTDIMKRTILFITSLVLIVGCSKPVEDSTLINKDGLMYLPDSDTPYSGEVYFNYDTGEKEYQGIYENGLLVIYSYLNKDGTVKEPVNGETLINRGGLLYEVNGQKPYTGDVFELYKDGGRKIEGSIKGGKFDKLLILWYENGQKMSEVTFKDGMIGDGSLFIRWYENGQKNIEGSHKNGIGDGLWTYWDKDGSEYEGKIIRKDDEDGTFLYWYDNEKTKIESHKTYKDGIEDGLGTSWSENGQKGLEVTYKDGKWIRHIVWFYYPNGQKESERTFKDMKLISVKEWNKDGSIKK